MSAKEVQAGERKSAKRDKASWRGKAGPYLLLPDDPPAATLPSLLPLLQSSLLICMHRWRQREKREGRRGMGAGDGGC